MLTLIKSFRTISLPITQVHVWYPIYHTVDLEHIIVCHLGYSILSNISMWWYLRQCCPSSNPSGQCLSPSHRFMYGIHSLYCVKWVALRKRVLNGLRRSNTKRSPSLGIWHRLFFFFFFFFWKVGVIPNEGWAWTLGTFSHNAAHVMVLTAMLSFIKSFRTMSLTITQVHVRYAQFVSLTQILARRADHLRFVTCEG